MLTSAYVICSFETVRSGSGRETDYVTLCNPLHTPILLYSFHCPNLKMRVNLMKLRFFVVWVWGVFKLRHGQCLSGPLAFPTMSPWQVHKGPIHAPAPGTGGWCAPELNTSKSWTVLHMLFVHTAKSAGPGGQSPQQSVRFRVLLQA